MAHTQQAGGALAVQADQMEWTEAQKAALVQLWGGKVPPPGDVLVLLNHAQRTGLDPFAKQLYMIQRGGRWGIQTSIDGFRVVRDRIAQQRQLAVGYEDTLWCGQDGTWVEAWLQPTPPAAAKVGLTITDKEGRSTRYSTVALWSEYGASDGLWKKMPALMLAKCGEALLLRKAFPHDLSGLYTEDEMAQQQQGVVEGTVVGRGEPPAPDLGALQTVWSSVLAATTQDALRDAWQAAKEANLLDTLVADPHAEPEHADIKVPLGKLVLLQKDRLTVGEAPAAGQPWEATVEAPAGGHPMDLPTEAEAAAAAAVVNYAACAYDGCVREAVVDDLWCLPHDPTKDSQSPITPDADKPQPGKAAMAKARADLAARQAAKEGK